MKRYGYAAVLLLHMAFPVLRLGSLVEPVEADPTETIPSQKVEAVTDEVAVAQLMDVTVEGRILSVGSLKLSLTTLSSDPVSFNVDKNATITLNGNTATLHDLSMGDLATVRAQRMGKTLIATAIHARTPF